MSDAGLATLPPSLRVLNMQFVAAGDLGLGFASRLARLECLNLYGCRRVGSACMAALSGLAELRLLSLGDTSVNDEGLKHLARCGARTFRFKSKFRVRAPQLCPRRRQR